MTEEEIQRLEAYAKRELDLVSKSTLAADEEALPIVIANVLDLIKVLSGQQTFGQSQKIVASWLADLACYKPLTPLSGEDDEWFELAPDALWQNIRCHHVYKDRRGPYDKEGIQKVSACGKYSRCKAEAITFPYWPKSRVELMSDEEAAESKAIFEKSEQG